MLLQEKSQNFKYKLAIVKKIRIAKYKLAIMRKKLEMPNIKNIKKIELRNINLKLRNIN